MISINETIAVPSPRKRVWEVLSDPAEVVSCISGAELGEAHEDGSFDGAVVVKFGALRVRFKARITLDLDESELQGRLTARGRDGQGATKFGAEATFRVAEADTPDAATVTMAGEIQISGKLASLIESGAGVVTTRMTRDFTTEFVQRCAEPAPADAPAAAETPVTAPAAQAGVWARVRAWWARLVGGRA